MKGTEEAVAGDFESWTMASRQPPSPSPSDRLPEFCRPNGGGLRTWREVLAFQNRVDLPLSARSACPGVSCLRRLPMRRCLLAVLASMYLAFVGCDDEPKPRRKSKPKADISATQPGTPAPTPSAPKRSTSPPPSAADSGPSQEQPVPSSPPSAPTPPPPTATAQLPIQLSTGVALPQTGPEGTLMGFSVDYEFAQGEPNAEGYVWVIERARGAAGRQNRKLSQKGNLVVLIQGWQPEDGPFKSHIEDSKGTRQSESIEMR
jgi:hypothetical protein